MIDYLVTPLDEIRGAVVTMFGGLARHEIFDGPTWDRTVNTLAGAHEQVGGATRRLIYATFAATRPDSDVDVNDVLRELAATIGIADLEHEGADSNAHLEGGDT